MYDKQVNKSLPWAIFKAFQGEFCTAFALCLFGASLSYISPFIVQRLISFLESDDQDTMDGFKLLAVLGASQLCSYVILTHNQYYQLMIGVKSKNALMAMVYHKQMRLSLATKQNFGQG